MIIIGITGTIGAGKGTVVEHLTKNKGFRHFSVRTFLTSVIEERHMPVNRDTMVLVANELRKEHGPAYIVEKLYEQAAKEKSHAIIESIRTPGEIDMLQALGSFYLLAVDAKPEIRYQRIVQRNSETDHISFETFLANELREMHTNDPNKQNLSKCIERANFVIHNNDGFDELYIQIALFLNSLNEDL